MSETTIDQQFVEYIAKSLVDNEGDVHVERVVDERGVLLTLYVNPADLGRVIGKRGAIAESIRTLLRSLGIKNSAHYNLKIADTDGGSNSTRPERMEPEEQDYSQYASKRSKTVENSQAPENATTEESSEEESDFIKNTRQELADLED